MGTYILPKMLNSIHQTKALVPNPARIKAKPNLTYLIWKNIANYHIDNMDNYLKTNMYQNPSCFKTFHNFSQEYNELPERKMSLCCHGWIQSTNPFCANMLT